MYYLVYLYFQFSYFVYVAITCSPCSKKQFFHLFFLFFFLQLFTIHIISQLTSLYDAREFSNERGRVERRAQFHKCRSRQMFTEAMSAYLNWITQAGVSFCFTFSIVYISIRTYKA